MNAYVDMSMSEIILNFAEGRKSFTLGDLSEFVRNRESISDSGILWHIKRLIKENKLSRLARGVYGEATKGEFIPTVSEKLVEVYENTVNEFPLIDVCVYSGIDISSLQHHLSSNNAIYIEVTKEATEAVFHWLIDNGFNAYHRPTEILMSEYVNLTEECVIVKSLVTESPLMKVDGIQTATLEKLLVDINTDADFYYLQGGETFYIMEQAQSLYQINQPKMLRYASRRGVRQKMLDLINYKEP